MQRGPQRRTGALDRAQRLRGRGQQVAESGWQGRRYASREAAGEAQFQVGGADSRAGGSGAGLRARIAGLVEGQVRCKPIGAAARVRAGGGISISTTVPWGVRCAVLQRPRTATVRHGYSTSARGSGSDSSLREQRQGRGLRASDNDGEREERHGAAEAEGGCGNERFGGQRRGALSKSDINHGRRALGGLDLDPDSTATTAGLS